MPTYEMKGYATPLINSEAEVEHVRPALIEELGADRVLPGIPPAMGSEDFQMLAQPFDDVPVLFLEVGAGTPDAYTNLMEKGQPPGSSTTTRDTKSTSRRSRPGRSP